MEKKLPKTKPPAREDDVLHYSSYVHQHHTRRHVNVVKGTGYVRPPLRRLAKTLGVRRSCALGRNRLVDTTPQPMVHFGVTGSGNSVMKSGQHRDQVAKADGTIAFEMEGAGVWDYFPSIVIKG
ncbi:hypothetical protein LTS06_012845, partial [Exophiala xenobiotica]